MSEQQAKFVERVLSNTGVLCRELLGMDYDEDQAGRRVNVGNGGIVPYGKHEEIVRLLDDPKTRYKLIEAPRESRKSSILQGFCVRHILKTPNIRIFYVARTDKMARDKALAIRNRLESDRVTDLFGPQKGPSWEETRFTVASRTDHGLMNATLEAFSMDSMPTGGRANIVVLDDFIDDTNCTNPEQIKKSKDKFAHLLPFVARGGILVVVGTRWDEGDLYADLEGNQLFAPPHGGQVLCGAGVRVVNDAQGRLDLELEDGGITFPHLTLDYLRQKLYGMARQGQADLFCAQYLNQVTSRTGVMFKRQHFQPLRWGTDMETLSGYLLTDTATSQKDSGCYSVVAYVGLDASDNIYVLDLRVGHWEPAEFVSEFFDVLETWQPKVNHCGEVWEQISLTEVFLDSIQKDSRARKTRLRPIMVRRHSAERKDARILRLHMPMSNKHFYVVDTVPKTFEDVDGTRELWNHEGFFDARTKTKMPSGELVDEFIKAGGNAKRDIPDALALIHEMENMGTRGWRRYCTYKPWRPKQGRSLTQQRRDAYHATEYPTASSEFGGDWWDRTLNGTG